MVGYVPTTLSALKKRGGKMKEIWKDIEGYEGKYQVSNMGNVRSFVANNQCEAPHVIYQATINTGYKCVHLLDNCARKVFLVHRLVAIAFIPNPDNLPLINHKDEDYFNNCVDNLEWCTHKYNYWYSRNRHPEKYTGEKFANRVIRRKRSDNRKQRVDCGIPRKHTYRVLQLSLSGTPIKEWDNAVTVCREFGWTSRNITDCCLGKRKTAYGYKWAFVK